MPPSVLAWLDYSEADQRRAREIVAMFSQPESRDELGLRPDPGRVERHAVPRNFGAANPVPDTCLFVPWLYRAGGRLGRRGPDLARWVETRERRLIGALSKGEDSAGLIGGIVGDAVQNLPSTIYWNSLRRFGILRHQGTPATDRGALPGFTSSGRRNRVPRTF